jgi:hypothetical protein
LIFLSNIGIIHTYENAEVSKMSSRVKYTNKKTGITYVYESVSYWDKELKQPRNKRVCIGKIDPQTGELVTSKKIIPTPGESSAITARAKVVGPTNVLNLFDKQLKITKLLKRCCPSHYEKIKAMAYYLVIKGGALCHCETWCNSYFPELAGELSSQRIADILPEIGARDVKQTFLKDWLVEMPENDYYCYDITSISSYAEYNEYIKYGYNRDKDKLAQLNLAVVFGQKSSLPAYYNPLAGNITDVTTLHNLIKTMSMLSAKKFHYVMDRGFYSKKNIDDLFSSRTKFITSVTLNNKWLQSAIDEIHLEVNGPNKFRRIGQDTVYVHSQLLPWGNERYRSYLHLYFNPLVRANDIDKFNTRLIQCKFELESGATSKEHQAYYDDYFIVKTTPKRGTTVNYNNEAIMTYLNRYTGFYALLTNSIKDPVESLQVYRNKDVVEKCFDDLKNQLDMKRLRMHSYQSSEAKLFIQFIALIYTSALRKAIKDANLDGKYTVRELLNEMANITQINYSGKYGHVITEISKSQREIMQALQITID